MVDPDSTEPSRPASRYFIPRLPRLASFRVLIILVIARASSERRMPVPAGNFNAASADGFSKEDS